MMIKQTKYDFSSVNNVLPASISSSESWCHDCTVIVEDQNESESVTLSLTATTSFAVDEWITEEIALTMMTLANIGQGFKYGRVNIVSTSRSVLVPVLVTQLKISVPVHDWHVEAIKSNGSNCSFTTSFDGDVCTVVFRTPLVNPELIEITVAER